MAKKSAPLTPTATLVKKRSLIVPVLAVALVLIAAVVIYFFASQRDEGTIIATVNGEPIYQEDVDAAYAQVPPQYQAQLTKEFLLNQTIDKQLLLQEARKRGIIVDEETVDQYEQQIRDEFGLTDEAFEQQLKAQNVTKDEYRDLVREELILSKVIEEAVLSRVSVSDEEVIEYYDAHPAEFSAPAGGAVIRHILVENESQAFALIEQLDADASFNELAQQYSMDTGSAPNGGYLGILTADSPIVPEFLSAALKLRTDQYTRTPVKTDFGYHIIKSEGAVEPFREVRTRIREQLELQKQKTAFQQFMQTLRQAAVIKYYTDDGVVTSTQEPKTTLDQFAACVGEKATLYGASWSEFSQQQQALFGESFSFLNYVDCGEKPHLCSAANIQKYPTWVVGSTEYGALTLKQLSEYTKCPLPR
jgi:parvulin-like peptidyl-prolyl isomerase